MLFLVIFSVDLYFVQKLLINIAIILEAFITCMAHIVFLYF